MPGLLIELGPPTVFQLGSRAIHWACRGGSLGVVKALKSHGADLNIRDEVNVHFICACICSRTNSCSYVIICHIMDGQPWFSRASTLLVFQLCLPYLQLISWIRCV